MSKKAWKNLYGLSRKSLTHGLTMAQSMIELYPDSPEGHKLLSLITTHFVLMGFASDPDLLKREAYNSAQIALDFDANDEHSQWALGLVLGFFQNRIAEAEAAFSRAIEINPNFSLGYGSLGSTLAYAGRAAESIEKTQYAIRLNPRDPSIFFRYSSLAISYFNLSDFEQARKWAQLSVERNSEWWVAHAILAASLLMLGLKQEAVEAGKVLFQISPALSLAKLPIEPIRPTAAKKLFYNALAELGIPT
jgi:adenylate cyclase